MFKWLKWLRKNEKGQGMVEYGLILTLVSIISIGALTDVGAKVSDTFDQVMDSEFVSGEPVYTKEEMINNLVKEGYIPIVTADELNSLRTVTSKTFGAGTDWEKEYTSGLDKKYIVVANIDLSGIDNFEPIGKLNSEFKGTFDGGAYIISNLKIDRGSEDNVGLFGRASGATFLNVGLENVNVTGGNRTGGLVGRQQTSSTVSNSYATGTVNGVGHTGGLVGSQSSSSVSNSYATGEVTGVSSVGGLVGSQSSSSVSNSYWDTETTKRVSSVGGAGKSTDEMKTQGTYKDWDNTIWEITDDQYPTLK